jgi:hypothetical protein
MSSIARARTYGALSQGVGNVGDALLQAIEKQRLQRNSEREMALNEKIQGGQLDLQGQRLAADIKNAIDDRRQRFTLSGFEEQPATPAPVAAPAPGTSILDQPVDITRGAHFGMEPSAAPISNPGDAVLRALSAGGGGEPTFRYNPDLDPEAVRQGRQNTFVGSENAADREVRERIAREGNATQLKGLGISEGGANSRNAADITSREKIAGMQYGPTRTLQQQEADAMGPRFDFTGKFVYPNADSVHAGFSRLGELQGVGGTGAPTGGGLTPDEVQALRAEAATSSPDQVAQRYHLTPAEKAQAFGQ